MKKQLLLAVILVTAFIVSKAQKPDTAHMLVYYKFIHQRDTANRAHPYIENMVLYIGKSSAAYRSYDGVVANEQFKKAYAEAAASSPDGNIRINRKGVGTPVEYYQYPNEHKMVTKEMVMANSYLIESAMPAIDWKIRNDTATFGGLHCQKATGHFKGRDYVAWFCPDLPVHAGPWKLNGLPGVIMDAHDSKNEVIFQFAGAEKAVYAESKSITAGMADKDVPPILWDLDYDLNLIAPPKRAIKTTQRELDRLRETMRKDPNGFVKVMNAGNGPQMDQVKGGPPRGPVINNPVELPEKK